MRLFIAIELSEPIREALAQAQSHLKYAGGDVKWVERDNIHLTLKFLGEASEEKAERVKTALDEIAGKMKPFDISLKDIGAFPNANYPRVIWVGLDKGVEESKTLAGGIDEAMSGLGFEKESRPFAAHLTIGRVRSSKNREALKEKLANYKLSTTNCKTISSIVLFKSALTSSGPIYTKLHEVKFS
jgi:2'-5' RNA ligase